MGFFSKMFGGSKRSNNSYVRDWTKRKMNEWRKSNDEWTPDTLFLTVMDLLCIFACNYPRGKVPPDIKELGMWASDHFSSDAALFEVGCYLFSHIDLWLYGNEPNRRELIYNLLADRFIELFTEALGSRKISMIFDQRLDSYGHLIRSREGAEKYQYHLSQLILYANNDHPLDDYSFDRYPVMVTDVYKSIGLKVELMAWEKTCIPLVIDSIKKYCDETQGFIGNKTTTKKESDEEIDSVKLIFGNESEAVSSASSDYVEDDAEIVMEEEVDLEKILFGNVHDETNKRTLTVSEEQSQELDFRESHLSNDNQERNDAGKVDLAHKYISDHKYEEAKTLLIDVCSRCPDAYQYEYTKDGSLFIKCWDMDEFVEYVVSKGKTTNKNVAWISSAYPRACYYLGYVYIENGNNAKAIQWLNKGLELEPNNPKFYIELGLIYGKQNDQKNAIDYYQKALKCPIVTKKERAISLRGIGVQLIDLKKFDEAEVKLKEALSIDPDNIIARNELNLISQLRKDQKPFVPNKIIFKSGQNDNTITWLGGTYIGQLMDNKPHGYGKIAMLNGVEYQGAWEYGKPSGVGRIVYTNGGVYEGIVNNGKRCRRGVYVFPDGRKLDGEWENGKYVGD